METSPPRLSQSISFALCKVVIWSLNISSGGSVASVLVEREGPVYIDSRRAHQIVLWGNSGTNTWLPMTVITDCLCNLPNQHRNTWNLLSLLETFHLCLEVLYKQTSGMKIKSVIDRYGATWRNNNHFERPTIFKSQGQRSNGSNRRAWTNRQTHKQMDAAKRIISPALRSIMRVV